MKNCELPILVSYDVGEFSKCEMYLRCHVIYECYKQILLKGECMLSFLNETVEDNSHFLGPSSWVEIIGWMVRSFKR